MTSNKGLHRPLTRGVLGSLALALGFVFLALFTVAIPEGPTQINASTPETRIANNAPVAIQAQAGNVTALSIDATRQTDAWQGYYGNISGTVVLQDADNFTFYSWEATSFEGEIFAANATVTDWGTVACVLMNGTAGLNASRLDAYYNINTGDSDDFTSTFNYSFGGSFQVGSVTINAASGCSEVYTFQNELPQTTNFQEVVLRTDGHEVVVYTTLIDDDTTGFDGNTYDFQMLVAEDGTTAGSRTYYFYVEIT